MSPFISYWRTVFQFTWKQVEGHWKSVIICYLCIPIADFFLFYQQGRAKASEWTFSSFMTQAFPLTVIGIIGTVIYLFLIAPYHLHRQLKDKLDEALLNIDRISNQPALQIEFDPKSCVEVTQIPGTHRGDYEFSVIVNSLRTVSGVIVSLEKLTGLDSFGHNNRPFEFKHQYVGNPQVTCNKGEKIPVDVLFYFGNKGKFQLRFQGEKKYLPESGPYVIRLRATGGGVDPVFKNYRIGVRDNTPFMEPTS